MKRILRAIRVRLQIAAKTLLLTFRGKTNLGYCYVCGGKTMFAELGPALRDSYACVRCNSRPRQRALMKVLQEQFPNWRSLKIYESSPSGPCSAKLKKLCKKYDCSQYYEDHEPGVTHQGFRCENLEALTMADDTYDLIITQDVFEHVLNPRQAFAEVGRVLAPGGAHVFTVPMFDQPETVVCAESNGEGGIRHLKPPSYHRNPVDPNGSLVVTEWGKDILEIIRQCSALESEIILTRDRNLGLDGRLLEVVVSRKLD